MSDSDLIPDETAPVEGASGASVPDAGAPQAPPKPKKKKSMFADPVVRWLAIIAAGLVIIYFVTVASALIMGVLGSPEPKSKVERDLQNYAGLTVKDPKNPAVWRAYVLALLADRQFSKAQNVIDGAKSLKAPDSQDLLLAQAELYYAKKDYKQAVKTADEVRTKLQTALDEKKKMKGAPGGQEINENAWIALLLKAESQVQMGDKKASLKSYDEYLTQYKTASDVFVRRGDIRAETGDKAGAEADYRQALRYIPTDAAALAGLKKIGVQK